MHVCWECGKNFRVDRSKEAFFGLGTVEVCSLKCLRSYVIDMTPLDKRDEAWRNVTTLSTGDTGRGMFYSHLLHASFRSGFEVMMAELLCLSWKVQGLFYEPHAIRTGSRGYYIPDFFLSMNDVWLEVKGEWHSGDKKKFKKAAGLIGPDRFVLVSPFYYNEIKKSSKGLLLI